MTPKQRQDWLAERRTGIGGSDAAAAVGLSKWKTRLELYLDKRGELDTAESEPMRWGNLLEPVVRQEYANRTGRTVEVPPGIIRHHSVKFALMTPDGIADGRRVLQVKTARTAEGWGEPGSADIPLEYVLQTQHEMFVTELPVADVAVLVGGSDFRIYEIPADAELQAMLIEQEAAFWVMVQAENPPDPMSREDIKRRWQVSSGAKFTAGAELIDACENLSQAKAVAAFVEQTIDNWQAVIQSQMAGAAELVSDDGDVLATWKNIKASPRFDLDRFKEEQPELWKQYLRNPTPQRRFLLKVKAGEVCQPQLPQPTIPALPMATAAP